MKDCSKPFSLITIFCLGIIVYSNSFLCSFHYDDQSSIVYNSAIKNIHHLQNIFDFWPGRFITYLSIALNYHFNGLYVFGYHLFNLAVHLITALLVWWLTLLTFSTPAMKGPANGGAGEKIAHHANSIALFASLIFVTHPIQTEAVTYIVQRAASMATMFYLASLCFYIKSRLLQEIKPTSVIASPQGEAIFNRTTLQKIFYFGSLLMAILAMFAKEITITLPVMILVYEFYFFVRADTRSARTIKWKRLFPFMFTILIIPLTFLLAASVKAQQIRGDTPSGISSIHYLLTQFRVMVTYIRLAFLPLNQNFDYDYPIYKNIFETPVLVSFLFLTAILFFATRLFSKYRLVSFSIFWFFLTLLPESSILPIKDIIFEHRMYLPLVGYSIFLVSSIYYLLLRRDAINGVSTTMVVMLIGIIICYSVLTYQRNKVWKDDITLWGDAVRKSPHKLRPYFRRAVSYSKQGDLDHAMADLNKCIALDPDYSYAYIDRGTIYEKQGKFTQALIDYNKAIKVGPKFRDAYYRRGTVYNKLGQLSEAISDYNESIAIDPYYADAYMDLGVTYAKAGNLIQAISEFNGALEIDPSYKEAYNNRSMVYFLLKNKDTISQESQK